MSIIIKNATIIDKSSEFHNKMVDIKIDNGRISDIAPNLNVKDSKEISLENLHISNGWMDASVFFGVPGFEERESIENGLNTAAKSGFTHVAHQPASFPVVDNQSIVSFLKSKAENHAVSLHPIGALTKNQEGNDLSEMFDMKNAGAIAFGDYKKSISNANLLKIALQYVQDFDGIAMAFCNESTVKGKGVVHEGIVSTRLGLKGSPALAEDLIVARNLFLLEYTGGKMHLPTISTAKAVDLIREAKAKGLKVSCSVAVHNLVLKDEVLEGFDTRFKVDPPLRDEVHRQALVKGVLDGTIDWITSDHYPLDIEHKKMEFDLAKDGTIGLESAFGALLRLFPLEIVVNKLTHAKTMLLNEKPEIKIGAKADLTLFNPDKDWVFTTENILSKSKNSAFLNQSMKGWVYGIFNNNQLILK